MDMNVSIVVRDMTKALDEEHVSFFEVVRTLTQVGVERYHADFICWSNTYYMPDGLFEIVACSPVTRPATRFSGEDIAAAVRALEVQAILYKEFCAHIAVGGCAGYLVSLVGRRVIYYGRGGETHTEWFPGVR